ncbi:MAG: hypothetical protein LE178_04865, partial [Endomicrobium sp.]|nr:hypothetical protein [Endomicrobium sp.]
FLLLKFFIGLFRVLGIKNVKQCAKHWKRLKTKKIELVDGVKVYANGGWALFVPDTDETLFYIWAEAKDKTIALGLLEIYS